MGALHELFEHVTEAVFGIDENRNIRFWNKNCENLLGLSHQQAIGKSCAELLCGKDLNGNSLCITECPIAKVCNAPVCDNDFRLVLDSGDNKPVLVTVNSYYINKSYQKNNDNIQAFHRVRPVIKHYPHQDLNLVSTLGNG